MSKVTIVIPNFNGKEYMDKCLVCLKNQIYKEAIETLLTAYEKEKEKNKELEKMLNLKSHKRRYNTMNYIKKNKLNNINKLNITLFNLYNINYSYYIN